MEELISMVMRDVAGVPRIAAEVVRDGEFAVVSADVDWMGIQRGMFEHLFESFVSPTPMRVNSFRHEVLIVAVSDGMLTHGVAGSFAKGLSVEEVPSRLAMSLDKAARTLIWRFSESSWVRKQSAEVSSTE